jgi:hypothetical protein
MAAIYLQLERRRRRRSLRRIGGRRVRRPGTMVLRRTHAGGGMWRTRL